jgi:hypothetical protein
MQLVGWPAGDVVANDYTGLGMRLVTDRQI